MDNDASQVSLSVAVAVDYGVHSLLLSLYTPENFLSFFTT